MRPTASLLALMALAGCPGGGNGGLPEGCITVNGSGGWAFLGDALTQTEPGDTVQLCGEINETVVIDHPLTFQGSFNAQGQFTNLWNAPDNEPALHILDGGAVTMDGVYIETTRNGITVEEGGTLDISRSFIQLDNPSSYGIEIVGGTVNADNIVINEAFWGAIQNTGGTLTLTNSDLVNAYRWGVRLDDGATADIRDTLIGGTRIRDETGEFNDGWAVFVCDDCSATLTDVDMQSNVLGGLYVELGTAEVSGGEWLGNFIDIWNDGGTVTASDLDLLDSIQYGLVAQAGTTTFTDVRMDGDPENGRFENPLTGSLEGTWGALVFDGEMTWTGGTIREQNGGGIFAQGNQAAQLPLVLNDLSIADNATAGVQVSLTDLEATNVKITGTRSYPDICYDDVNFAYNCDWGLAAFQSDIDWIGGSLRDNELLGAVISDGPSDFTGLELANNELWGIWSLNAVVNLIGADVHGRGSVALEANQGSFITIQDSTFHDRDHESVLVSEPYEFVYKLEAYEVEAIDASVEVSNTVFRDGNNGLAAFSGSELTLTDVVMDGYNNQALRASGSTLDVDRTDLTRIGGDAILCSGNAEVALERTSISDARKVVFSSETYIDGELSASNDTEVSRPAIRGTACNFRASRLTLADLEGQAIDLTDSAIDELDRVTITRANTLVPATATPQPAARFIWTSTAPELASSDLSIEDVRAGDALHLERTAENESDTEGVSVSEFSIANVAAGSGVRAVGLLELELVDFTVQQTAGDGVVVANSIGSVRGQEQTSAISQTGGAGLSLTDSLLSVSNLAIGESAADGVLLSGGEVTLTEVLVEQAGGYGMSCTTDPAWPVCTDVSASGAAGEHDGCDACFPVATEL